MEEEIKPIYIDQHYTQLEPLERELGVKWSNKMDTYFHFENYKDSKILRFNVYIRGTEMFTTYIEHDKYPPKRKYGRFY